MPRRLRLASGGIAYHVLNRAVARVQLFQSDADYLAFERIIHRTFDLLPMRIVSYCLMPTHWHFVLWPKNDGQLSEFMRLLTVTHTQRRHAHRHTAGTGPLYQGRFKSFPIQQDEHLLTVCRYVERNPVRAKLARSAQQWAWGSMSKRQQQPPWLLPRSSWAVDPPSDWEAWVNRAETSAELLAVRSSVTRGSPFGNEKWRWRTARKLGLNSTLRPRGRPRVRPIKTPDPFDLPTPLIFRPL